MLVVSRKVDYGLRLLVSLSQKKGKLVAVKKVAAEYELPYKFLSQIAAELKEAGVLESKEGVKGGYKLARAAEYISVGEVVEALEGVESDHGCIRGEACECGQYCVRDEVEGPMKAAAIAAVETKTIADLC
jgi:Rrf2 family transcriptional regulator, cysteine metabolism repressor